MTLVTGPPVPTFEVAFRALQTLRERIRRHRAPRRTGVTQSELPLRAHGLNLHAPSYGPSVGDTARWFLCSGCMNSAVDGLPIKAQVLPSDSTPGSMTMSEGVSGESRADELVWVAGCAGLLG